VAGTTQANVASRFSRVYGHWLILAVGLLFAGALQLAAQGGPGSLVRTEIPTDQAGVLMQNFSVAEASRPVANNGQSLHLLVVFSNAAADETTTLCRIEAAFDCGSPADVSCSAAEWFPISFDLTTLRQVASLGITYGMVRANGSYPYIRANCPTVDAANTHTVRYLGATFPIGNVAFLGDRWIIGSPFSTGQNLNWALCLGTPCATGNDLTNHLVVLSAGAISQCWITAKTAPVGSDLIVNINVNGTSIFGGGPFLVLPDGQTGPVPTVTFNAPGVTTGDLVSIDITGIGSGTAGQDVTVLCPISQ
jgi:hypothetical protein